MNWNNVVKTLYNSRRGKQEMWVSSYTCCLFSGWALTFIAAPARRPPSLTHISSSPWDQRNPTYSLIIFQSNGACMLDDDQTFQSSIRARSQPPSCSQTRCWCGNSSWTCLSSLCQNLCIGLRSPQSYTYSSTTAQQTGITSVQRNRRNRLTTKLSLVYCHRGHIYVYEICKQSYGVE